MAHRYGSDRLVNAIAELGIDHLALNPGATIRGLHDSLVNPTDKAPGVVLALHEEIAVAVAHGYAKASGSPMAVALHDTVGLLHATMALFNAWVDRVPMLVLVGTGPMDAERRRPWIDWVHTVGEQGDLVRHFTKWNDQPSSLDALVRSVRRGWRTSMTQPQGPALVGLDVLLQETPSDGAEGGPLHDDLRVVSRLAPDPALVELALRRLHGARRPLAVTDRPLTGEAAAALVRLAERAGIALLESGAGGTFPVGHPHDVTDQASAALSGADLLVFVDVRDPARTLGRIDLASRRMSGEGSGAASIAIGLTEATDQSWMVTESDRPARFTLVADPALALQALEAGWGDARRPLDHAMARLAGLDEVVPPTAGRLDRGALVHAVADATREYDVVLSNAGILRGPATRRAFRFQRPDQFLGQSGGEGLGYGAPASLGAALAWRGSDRLVVNLQGDGDLLYVPQSLWTAAHHGIPLLIVVDANRTYLQDRHHQEAIARTRKRPEERVGVGIDLTGPDVRFADLARSFGVHAEGPVADVTALQTALRSAITRVREGEPVLVEVETVTAPE
jgi:thiamine pyrophosphate-dependent acetolactate synthase large subunit-like protein